MSYSFVDSFRAGPK